jgi:hypothetical protein
MNIDDSGPIFPQIRRRTRQTQIRTAAERSDQARMKKAAQWAAHKIGCRDYWLVSTDCRTIISSTICIMSMRFSSMSRRFSVMASAPPIRQP